MAPPPTGPTFSANQNANNVASSSGQAEDKFDPLLALMAPPPRSISSSSLQSSTTAALDPLAALMAPPPSRQLYSASSLNNANQNQPQQAPAPSVWVPPPLPVTSTTTSSWQIHQNDQTQHETLENIPLG